MKLVDKYRPACFADVFGQGHARKLLSNLIARGQKRNLLLYGAVGSGKTTLARIYGKALGCLNREAGGSPCDVCDNCKGFLFIEKDGTAISTQTIDQIVGSVTPGRVLFIDEAHALSKNAQESLLKPIDDKPDLTIILATTEPSKISTPVRSRLFPVEFRPLSIGKSVDFLRLIADKEQIECDSDALHLIAADSDGQARDLLQRLDQARFDGKVTLATVRDQLGISFSESLVTYLMALAEGAVEKQAQSFYEWDETSSQKLRLIQNFLFSAFARDVAKLSVDVDPILSAISGAARSEIIGRWTLRVGADVFPQYLKSLISSWPVLSGGISDAAINLQILQFHEVVNAPMAPAITAKSPKTNAQKSEYGNRPLPSPSAPNPNYFTNDEARRIFNTASRMVQAYGVRFNARITLWHRAFGIENLKGAADNTEVFNGLIRTHLKQPTYSSGYRLSVNGFDPKVGHWTRIAAVVPGGRFKKLENAIDGWAAKKQVQKQLKAINIEFLSQGAKPDVFHRDSVKWLAGGIDPDTKILLDNGSSESLLGVLIPKKLRGSVGDIGNGNRITTSKALCEKTFERQTEFKMAFLLPFDCQEWEHVSGKWEIEEHQARIQTITERREALEEAASASANAVEKEAAMKEIVEQWNDDPRERMRKWPVWWKSTAF